MFFAIFLNVHQSFFKSWLHFQISTTKSSLAFRTYKIEWMLFSHGNKAHISPFRFIVDKWLVINNLVQIDCGKTYFTPSKQLLIFARKAIQAMLF